MLSIKFLFTFSNNIRKIVFKFYIYSKIFIISIIHEFKLYQTMLILIKHRLYRGYQIV